MSSRDEIELLQLLEAERLAQLKEKDDLWYAGNLRFLLHSAQHIIYDKFHATNDRETVMLCSRRFGKSYLSVILCLEHAIKNPYTIVRFVPPEIKQAWQITMPIMLKLEQSWPRGLVRYQAAEKAWKVGRGSWLYLGGFDSQADAQRGGEASLIVCDEAGFTSPETYGYIMKSVLKPQLLTTRGRMLIPSTPSREPDHEFLTNTVQDAKLEGRLHKYTIYDNPLLDEDQIEQAKRDCGGEDTEDWKREYLCEIVRSKSITVVPRWDTATYVQEFEPQPWQARVLVGDFGGVNDKTVIHVLAYDYQSPVHGVFQFVDERVYDPGTTTEEIVAGIRALHKQWLKPSEFPEQDQTAYLDCPGQLQVDLNNHHNISVRIPLKDDFHAGVNLINIMVNMRRILVHPRCKFTILSMESARFNDRRTDYIRSPVLGHCDAIASAIYGIRMICKDRDGSPVPRVNQDSQAYWKLKPKQDRAAVANAIYGRKQG
jgi:hypothetical protein